MLIDLLSSNPCLTTSFAKSHFSLISLLYPFSQM